MLIPSLQWKLGFQSFSLFSCFLLEIFGFWVTGISGELAMLSRVSKPLMTSNPSHARSNSLSDWPAHLPPQCPPPPPPPPGGQVSARQCGCKSRLYDNGFSEQAVPSVNPSWWTHMVASTSWYTLFTCKSGPRWVCRELKAVCASSMEQSLVQTSQHLLAGPYKPLGMHSIPTFPEKAVSRYRFGDHMDLCGMLLI